MSVVVRASGDPSIVAGELRQQLHQLQPQAPLASVRTFDTIVDASVAQRRFQLELVLVFAAVALLLAALGVYGVVAQSVARRAREIGLRLALGATRADVGRLVAIQGLAPVGVGLVAGLIGALFLARLLRELLFGISATDLPTFGVVSAVLVLTSFLACLVPARRATRVDPIAVLRGD